MNIKITLAVLAIAVVLGGVAVYRLNTTPSDTDKTAEDLTNRRLLDPQNFDPESVRGISISTAQGPTNAYVREGDQWRQTEPIEYAVQTWSLRQVATAAADVVVTDTIEPDELEGDLDPARLGLNPPAATVVYDLVENDVSVQLGRMFVAGQAYARLEPDGPVYVVTDGLHKQVLDRDFKEWRSRRIFPEIDQAQVSRITIERADTAEAEPETIRLARVDGRWFVQEPIQARADEQAVNRLVTDVASASIRGFVRDDPGDLSAFGLADPEGRITVETEAPTGDGTIESRSLRLLLGYTVDMADETTYAKRGDRPDVFTVDAWQKERFAPDLDSLVSRRVVDLPAEEIRALSIATPTERFRLERSTDGWMAVDDQGQATPAEPHLVEPLLARLTEPREGVERGQLEIGPADPPLATITVEDFSGNQVATVRVGQRDAAAGEDDTDDELVLDDTEGDGESDDAATSIQTVYDAGDGLIRFDAEGLPPLSLEDFQLTPGASPGDVGPMPPVEEPNK